MTRMVFAAVAVAMVAGLVAAPVEARPTGPQPAAKVAQSQNYGERSLLNINNMSLWFRKDGWSGRNPINQNSGVTYPRSTDQVIFQDGLIWGGIVNDGDPQTLRVGGQTYEIGTVPGAILSKGEAEDQADPSVRIYRIRRDYATADLRLDASELFNLGLSEVSDADIAELRAQYAKDWEEWPVAKGAPYYDTNGNGAYDAGVDEPGVAGADQVAWLVINDLDLGAATSLYGSKPIGMEVQVTLWGYARSDALGDVIFKKYKMIYKGTATAPDDATIEDMYVAQWADPDVGDYSDDFAGSDIDLSLGYAYNGGESDSHYDAFDLAPPAVGYDFLQGPIVPDSTSTAIFNFGLRPGYRNLPMTSYVFFAAGSAIDDPELGEYVGTEEWYNLLRGFQPQPDINNSVPFTNPLTNEDTKFTLAGDPTRATGWNDGVPLPAGDRRIVLNTGPFTMALGDTQEVVVALLGGSSSSRLRSVAKLKFTDQFVQDAYNSFFQVPSPPTAPSVRAAQLDQSIVLDWGWDPVAVDATEGEQSAGFEFEGYNIYQLPSAEATLSQGTKLATYDLENGVTTILGIDLDEESGVVLDVPQQIGTDSGLRRNITIRTDAIRGGPLVNGQAYYFGVTAYNRATSEDAAVKTLESSPQLLVVKPQQAPPGTRYKADAAMTLEGQHGTGASDGSVVALVVDPTQTTGDTYEVRFADDGGTVTWNLVNTTSGATLLSGQTDQTGAANYIGADGFEVAVSGPPNGMKDWDIPSGERWYTWAGGAADWGMEGFQGAITGDMNHQWFNETTLTAADLKTVELRFTSVHEEDGEDQYKPLDNSNENVSWAYRYMRGANADVPAPGDLTSTSVGYDWSAYVTPVDKGGYRFLDRRQICLSAWDVESDPPRRLEVAFLEDNVPGGLVNGAYGPAFYGTASNTSGTGPREWLFVFDLDYTAPADAVDGAGAQDGRALLKDNSLYLAEDSDELLPLMWWVLAARRGDTRFPMDGDSFLMIANHVNTAADVFSFTVPGTEASDALLKEDVKNIRVFPNPYYGVNQAETSRYSSFVTFDHLPTQATIRIFDLSGTLVRVIDKDNADQFLRWDLSNDNGLPVASGLYIAHIEMPGVGSSKVVKLAVVMEEEFLENF